MSCKEFEFASSLLCILDCSQPLYNLRTQKKKPAKRVRSTREWGVGFASEASKKHKKKSQNEIPLSLNPNI